MLAFACEKYVEGQPCPLDALSIAQTIVRYNYDTRKSDVPVFKFGNLQPCSIPPVTFNRLKLNVVHNFMYLGQIVTDNLADVMDIEMKRRM